MALKTLMAKRRLDLANAKLEELRAKDADFEKREAELEASIEEVQTDDEKTAVTEAVDTFNAEKDAHEAAKTALENEIRGIEEEIKAEEAKQDTAQKSDTTKSGERKVSIQMETRVRFATMSMEQRTAFVQREDVHNWLSSVRAMMQHRAINNSEIAIPTVSLPLIYEEAKLNSQLLRFVNLKEIKGKARQRIMGNVAEAVWTEMCASLNEIDLGLYDVEVDGYKVGAYFKICNALLEDNDVALANELISVLGAAIGKALDRAILFGTGVKMPLGISTRLAQTEEPAQYPATAYPWEDLHTSNVLTLNIGATSGTNFFESLILAAAVIKKHGNTTGGLFWAMNHKTKMTILAKALAFNAAAALTAGVNNQMPIIGGEIVEVETIEMQDGEIIGGYGDAYLMVQREGAKFGMSEHQFFTDDQTVFKGTARYDGKPVFADSFVVINFQNTAPTTSSTFPIDYANTELGTLTVVAAAHGTTAGKTVLTVTGTEASGTTLKYKIGDYDLTTGDKLGAGWTALTSGTTAITAAAGTVITVVELDAAGRVIKRGDAESVPKTS